jgi:hypothetical protein
MRGGNLAGGGREGGALVLLRFSEEEGHSCGACLNRRLAVVSVAARRVHTQQSGCEYGRRGRSRFGAADGWGEAAGG